MQIKTMSSALNSYRFCTSLCPISFCTLLRNERKEDCWIRFTDKVFRAALVGESLCRLLLRGVSKRKGNSKMFWSYDCPKFMVKNRNLNLILFWFQLWKTMKIAEKKLTRKFWPKLLRRKCFKLVRSNNRFGSRVWVSCFDSEILDFVMYWIIKWSIKTVWIRTRRIRRSRSWKASLRRGKFDLAR